MTSVSGYTPVLTKSQKRNKKRRDKVRLAKQEQAREQQKEQGQSTEPEASSTLPAAQPSQGQAELGTDRIRKPRLEKWYKDYITKNNLFELLREVDVDKLDEECVERQVHESMPSTQIQDGYCTVCHKFLESWVKMSSPTSLETTGDFDLPWHANLTQFEASSRRSCQFCKLWLQAIGPRNLLRLRKIDKRLSFLGKPRFLSIRTSSRYEMVYLYWPGTTITSWHPVALAAIRTEASDSFSNEPALRAERGQTSMNTAKSWLDACSTNHTQCNIKNTERLPTRLLAVKEDPVKLVLTQDWITNPSYSTLSHCWGISAFPKLTQSSLGSFMSSIPTEELTRTFTDAISITRALGIDYLWIDSLCIIQDSDQDWQTESALMSSVYSGSKINIAAAAAHDGTEGCFCQPSEYTKSVHVEEVVSGQKLAYTFVQEDIYLASLFKTHLASRAWALQERFLSPRTIHFGPRELFWECKEKDACESFPNTFPISLIGTYYRERRPLMEIWNTIVRFYTSAKLTYGKDKLVAISGIARAAKHETDDEYIAGMWKHNLERQLCWSFDSPPLPRPAPYRAPTWSWASIDGLIYYPDPTHKLKIIDQYAHVLDVSLTPAGTDSFGQLQGGVLKLGIKFMLPGRMNGGNFLVSLPGRDIQFDHYSTHLDTSGDVCDTEADVLYLMPMERRGRRDSGYCSVKCLLLRPTNGKKGQYSRVGIISEKVLSNEWGKDKNNIFLEALHTIGPEIARKSCAEIVTEPEELFVLYIV